MTNQRTSLSRKGTQHKVEQRPPYPWPIALWTGMVNPGGCLGYALCLSRVIQPHSKPKTINSWIQSSPQISTLCYQGSAKVYFSPSRPTKELLQPPGTTKELLQHHSFQLGRTYISGYHLYPLGYHPSPHSTVMDDFPQWLHVDIKKAQKAHQTLWHPMKQRLQTGSLTLYWHQLGSVSEERGESSQRCTAHPELPKLAPKDTYWMVSKISEMSTWARIDTPFLLLPENIH